MKLRRGLLANTPHLETASGQLISFVTDVPALLKGCTISLLIDQPGSGSPSPSNIRPIAGYDGVTVSVSSGLSGGTQYPVSWSSVGTIGSGTVDLINGVLTQTHVYVQYVGASDEAWNVENNTNFYIMTPTTWLRNTTGATLACNMALSFTSVGPGTCRITNTGNFNISIGSAIGVSTVAGWKEYLANHPLQVVCQLKTPVTYQLSPLSIKTLYGANYIGAGNDASLNISYWSHVGGATALNTIGGLPVLINNAYYPNNNGAIDAVVSNNDFFIAGPFDTGSTSNKSLTMTRTLASFNVDFRLFNDLNDTSYDYWSINSTFVPSIRTLTSGGRYVLYSINKSVAADMYMYDNTNQRYIFKGSSIPNFIDGIPVLFDNARYAAQNGAFNNFESSSDYFLTGWFDTGSTGSKQYEFGPANANTVSAYMAARWFDSKTGNSVDYWRPNDFNVKTVDSAGQFIVATVYKPTASTFYLYDKTNGVYLFKGKDVI